MIRKIFIIKKFFCCLFKFCDSDSRSLSLSQQNAQLQMVIPFDHLYDTHRASQHELHTAVHSHHAHHEPGHHAHHGHHLIASYGITDNYNNYDYSNNNLLTTDPTLSIDGDHVGSSSSMNHALYLSAQYHNTGVDGVHHYRPLNLSKIDCQLLMQHQYLPTL